MGMENAVQGACYMIFGIIYHHQINQWTMIRKGTYSEEHWEVSEIGKCQGGGHQGLCLASEKQNHIKISLHQFIENQEKRHLSTKFNKKEVDTFLKEKDAAMEEIKIDEDIPKKNEIEIISADLAEKNKINKENNLNNLNNINSIIIMKMIFRKNFFIGSLY